MEPPSKGFLLVACNNTVGMGRFRPALPFGEGGRSVPSHPYRDSLVDDGRPLVILVSSNALSCEFTTVVDGL